MPEIKRLDEKIVNANGEEISSGSIPIDSVLSMLKRFDATTTINTLGKMKENNGKITYKDIYVNALLYNDSGSKSSLTMDIIINVSDAIKKIKECDKSVELSIDIMKRIKDNIIKMTNDGSLNIFISSQLLKNIDISDKE